MMRIPQQTAAMKTILCLALSLSCLAAVNAAADGVPSWGREVIHYKINPRTGVEERTGSTESESDPSRNLLSQVTKNSQGVVTMRREFIMDSKGRIRRGVLWDGQGNPQGRTEYGFDSYDRINEERLFFNGRLIRRMLFKYDATSRRLVDKFYILNEKDPNGRLVESKPRADDVPFLPVTKADKELPGFGIPQFRGMEAPAGQPGAPAGAAPQPPPKKKGFFDKMFKR